MNQIAQQSKDQPDQKVILPGCSPRSGLPPPRGPHTGFQPGNRVAGRRILDSGKTLPQLAREHSDEAFAYIVSVLRGEEPRADAKLQMRAAEIILERGYGKAAQFVQLDVNQASTDPSQMAPSQLASEAAKVLERLSDEDDIIEGELAVPSAVQNEEVP